MSWQNAPIATLDIQAIGEVLLRLPLVAVQLGHTDLERTDTYLHPNLAEARYVIDVVFGLARGDITIDEFVDRWYGGDVGARDMLRAIADAAVPA